LLGGAYALLHLINFDEPFGLSMVEAMACGTPVIATRRGSVPEVVSDGLTGFVVSRAEDALAVLPSVRELKRPLIRGYVAENFSSERMVDGYIRVYERTLGGSGNATPCPS
jgi:glycosyltransferase involved in cell wall biosynthesis